MAQAPSVVPATAGVPGRLALQEPGLRVHGQAGGVALRALLRPGVVGLKARGERPMRRGRLGLVARLPPLLRPSSPLP